MVKNSMAAGLRKDKKNARHAERTASFIVNKQAATAAMLNGCRESKNADVGKDCN
jgi:predicted RNA binding protein with dsRBD fold (UPF0201 family)